MTIKLFFLICCMAGRKRVVGEKIRGSLFYYFSLETLQKVFEM